MKLLIFTTSLIILSASSAFALHAHPSAGANALKIFTYEKNINSENIMVVHTNTDSNCLPLLNASKQPVIDFYWLMNRITYKPVNSIIKSNIRKRISATTSPEKNIFYINLKDLSEVAIDIPDTRLVITTFFNSDGQCNAMGTMTLGASDGNTTLLLDRIYVEAQRTLNPFRPKVKSITLDGTDVSTGAKKSRTYSAK